MAEIFHIFKAHHKFESAYLDDPTLADAILSTVSFTVGHCFCKENWPKLLEWLKGLYREEVARQSAA